MKTLLLLFTFLLFQNPADSDCKGFYEKNIPDEIYGKVIEKKENDGYYRIKIKDSVQNKEIEVSLLKNKTGKEIYDFLQKESIVKKRKGSLSLSALTSIKGGGFDDRSFPDLCK